MEIEESGLTFSFSGEKGIKFDDSKFYRNYFNTLPAAKGVDIIYADPDALLLLEIKNCNGHETENRWRIGCNNKNVSEAERIAGRDSLDIEISKKVAMTISCLVGAHSKKSGCESAEELDQFVTEMMDMKITNDKRRLLVVLFLEGNFQAQTRSKKMIMQAIAESIRKKLHWLNCTVSVVDSNTYSKKIFKVN